MNNPHMHPKWKRLADSSGWTMVFGSQSLLDESLLDVYPVWVGRVYGVYPLNGRYEVHLLGTKEEVPFWTTDIDLAIMIAESWDEMIVRGDHYARPQGIPATTEAEPGLAGA